MHSWGDGFAYFSEVGQAADEIGTFCRRWGRICVMSTKEKWGTARVYCSFGVRDLHGLIYPGWVRVRGPYWLMTFPLLSWFQVPVVAYQTFIYRLAYKRALKKYPMIRDEILGGADWNEYLEGL